MVEVVETAVSSRTGQAALHGIGSATARVADHDDRPAIRVRATTLDDHLGEHARAPVVVKIDVEGHEREVLAGMGRLLETCSPVLVVETHGTADGVRADLDRRGYTATSLGASHLLCVRTVTR
jgi:FkbM family methyltransferase